MPRITVLSTSRVTWSPETALVIPAPPTTVSVSPPEMVVVPESPVKVNDVEIDSVLIDVTRPFAATVTTGMAVEEPY